MRTSTFRLSTSQQVIFAVVFTLAILFAGCSETYSPTGEGSGLVLDPAPLVGNWIGPSQEDGNSHTLIISETQGSYTVSDTAEECGGYPKEVKVFNFERTSSNTIQTEVIHHSVCGEQLQTDEETVFYSLYNENNLRIFNQSFIRN